MIPNELYAKTYDIENYNCTHFAADIWLCLTGEDISEFMSLFIPKTGIVGNIYDSQNRRLFKRVRKPESPSIVLISSKMADAHVGVWNKNGVFHISSFSGVKFEKLENMTNNFSRVRFYVKNNIHSG